MTTTPQRRPNPVYLAGAAGLTSLSLGVIFPTAVEAVEDAIEAAGDRAENEARVAAVNQAIRSKTKLLPNPTQLNLSDQHDARTLSLTY